MLYGDKDSGNICSGNNILPDGIKPVPEPISILISEVLWNSLESKC